MKNILIVSATSNTNLKLANDILSFIDKNNFKIKIINLENLKLPLFNTQTFNQDKKKHYKNILDLTNDFVDSNGLIFCGPEYNGSIPPVITNAIAWISTSTDYWKDGFKNKNCLISSSSGGEATKFQISMEHQLSHLGGIVYKTKIINTSKKKMSHTKQKKIINNFIKLL